MDMRRLLTGFCVALLAVVICSCAGTNNDAPPFKDGQHPADWVSNHGSWLASRGISNGVNTCFSCHGEDLSGGIAKVACSTCHGTGFDFGAGGHPAGWLTGHGALVVSNGVSGCTTCHGVDQSGGVAKVACSSCHGDSLVITASTIGHPANWADVVPSSTVQNQSAIRAIPFYNFSATYHGFVAKGAPAVNGNPVPFGSNYCVTCHNVSASATLPFGVAPSCVGCHGPTGAPHPSALADDPNSKWAHWHHITTDPANAPYCAQCHANRNNFDTTYWTNFANYSSRNNPRYVADNSCFNGTLCHNGDVVQNAITPHFPQGLDITNHTVHGDQHQTNGQSCKICHGDKLQGRGAAPACSLCHGAQPATANTAAYQATTCASCHNSAGTVPPVYPKHCADCHTPTNPPENICTYCHSYPL